MCNYKRKYEEAEERLSKFIEKYKGSTFLKEGKMYEELINILPKLEEEKDNDKYAKESLLDWLKRYEVNHPNRDLWISWITSLDDIRMIQWTGDNLRKVVEFTGLSPRFKEWFNSWDEYESYVHHHNNIFKLFIDDETCYEVPVGAWIIKTPDGYNIPSVFTYNSAAGIHKQESIFKVGDWIINETSKKVTRVNTINHGLYFTEEGTIQIGKESGWSIWNVKNNAKQGDVLTAGQVIIIFKSYSDHSIFSYLSYQETLGFRDKETCWGIKWWHPATEEQKDILFQKIKESGYVWEEKDMVLKRIENE